MINSSNPLSASLRELKGVGPKLSQLLSKKGIDSFEDALYNIPRAYQDRSKITPIAQLLPSVSATVLGKVATSRMIRNGRRSSRFEATIVDKTGSMKLVWFRAYPSLAAEFAKGQCVLVFGQVEYFAGIAQIAHPDYELVPPDREGKPATSYHFGRVVPVYSETEGLNQKVIRRIMAEALKSSLQYLNDPLPETLRSRLHLPSLRDSFISIHFPKEFPEEGKLSAALRRVVFEEFFVLQLGLGLKKQQLRQHEAPLLRDESNQLAAFLKGLPFPLTADQSRAIEEIRQEVAKSRPMTRLLQGDVGAGKTVVALAGATLAASSGYQAAVMAPTEILAQQHFATAEKWLRPLGIEPVLLVSANSGKKEIREAVSSGRAQVVIGTHALFQSGIAFKDLGFVVVDEQHRFGVEQRNELVKKGSVRVPHLLMMTATPIPRTLALTLYGELDFSLLRQKPSGRIPVKTMILRGKERPRLYSKMRERIERGEQVYVIYPLVEDSEKLELKSATQMHALLCKEIFPQFQVALLHGRMKAEEKETILNDFKNRKYHILVSTTVIEVGIDVPNATLMVIEHPERLGLSQLHQLRGRVGRGSQASECLLVAETYVGERLKVMEKTEDGFEIAEEDLKIRGPGEFLGTRQSGLPGFRVGHLLRDAEWLSIAREEAQKMLQEDPELSKAEHSPIRAMVESRWKEKIERLMGG